MLKLKFPVVDHRLLLLLCSRRRGVPSLGFSPILRNSFALLAALLAIASNSLVIAQNGASDPPFGTSDTNVGYIDSAIPATQFRLRFDSAYDNPLPDRAEFFYRAAMSPNGGVPTAAETSVDYQDIASYLEVAVSSNASVFLEAPVRFVNPELNPNTSGIGDLQVGFKRALWVDANELLTFQLRTYLPTGNADRRLGTDHVSLEPGLLYATRLDRLTTIESEFRAWIPIASTKTAAGDFAGRILRYGIGMGRDIYRRDGCGCCGPCSQRLTTVVEFVGWSVLDGLGTVSTSTGPIRIEVGGDTILNGKFGLRWTEPGQSLFVGYGRGLTGDVWYQDIVRAEYVIRF